MPLADLPDGQNVISQPCPACGAGPTGLVTDPAQVTEPSPLALLIAGLLIIKFITRRDGG